MRKAGQASNLVEILRRHACDRGDRPAVLFVGERDSVQVISYRELDRRAQVIAERLRRISEPNTRVILLYPPGPDFVEGFFGCLYAGMIAVPALSPSPRRLERSFARLRTIIDDCEAAISLTTRSLFSLAEDALEHCAKFEDVRWLTTDDLRAEEASTNWEPPAMADETIALLQYTSGSTGTAKGVTVTHGNLVSNHAQIREAFATNRNRVVGGWLPLYHDMGLIGQLLYPLYLGATTVLMSPVHFVRDPMSWLELIHRHRIAVSGGPNFAYELCVSRYDAERAARLDLSRWKVAFCGSEPIDPATLNKFARRFSGTGFSQDAFLPCYGLAEATLYVTSTSRGEGVKSARLSRQALKVRRVRQDAPQDAPEDAAALVGCGRAQLGTQVRIVDPETLLECDPDQVGEIWISGPSIAKGYWKKPVETQAVFGARIADSSEGPFLRTGDLGFMRGGQLFITGRIKDLIIVRGANHYPEDIERTVLESHGWLRSSRCAVFSQETDSRIVVAAEVPHRYAREVSDCETGIFAAIRGAVSARHDLRLHSVVLLRSGEIPRTTSGKVMRRACREALGSNHLKVIAVNNY
ncbi:MAG: fatty acyl-AMP ligase [Candidatus Binataceae bacterium]